MQGRVVSSAIAMCFFLSGPPSSAQPVPLPAGEATTVATKLDFEGAYIGMPVAELNALYGTTLECRPSSAEPGVQVCGFPAGLMPVPATTAFGASIEAYVFTLDGDLRLRAASAGLRPGNFQQLTQNIAKKFGAGVVIATPPIPDRAGGTLPNPTMVWTRGADQLKAEKYGDSLDQSRVTISSKGSGERR